MTGYEETSEDVRMSSAEKSKGPRKCRSRARDEGATIRLFPAAIFFPLLSSPPDCVLCNAI